MYLQFSLFSTKKLGQKLFLKLPYVVHPVVSRTLSSFVRGVVECWIHESKMAAYSLLPVIPDRSGGSDIRNAEVGSCNADCAHLVISECKQTYSINKHTLNNVKLNVRLAWVSPSWLWAETHSGRAANCSLRFRLDSNCVVMFNLNAVLAQ